MNSKTKNITEIGIALATLIVGGYAIFMVGGAIVLPGFKYLLMGPYLSLVMTIVIMRIKVKYLIFKFNLVFAGIMSMLNIFMGLSILLTGIATELTTSLVRGNLKLKSVVGGSFYSGYVTMSALIVSKMMIGGPIFEKITNTWILIAFLIACLLGFIGSRFGIFISDRIGGAGE